MCLSSQEDRRRRRSRGETRKETYIYKIGALDNFVLRYTQLHPPTQRYISAADRVGTFSHYITLGFLGGLLLLKLIKILQCKLIIISDSITHWKQPQTPDGRFIKHRNVYYQPAAEGSLNIYIPRLLRPQEFFQFSVYKFTSNVIVGKLRTFRDIKAYFFTFSES